MADVLTDTAAQRAHRDAAIRRTITATLGARAFSVTCTFVQIPVALSWLGQEGYGFWIALTGATLLLNVADFGLGAGMQNEIGTALARGEPRRGAAQFATAFLLLAIIALVLAAAGTVGAHAIAWDRLFHLTDARLTAAAPHAATAALLVFCIGLPLSAAARLAQACQWGWLIALWSAVASAAQLAAVYFAGRAQLSFVAFVWLAGAATVAPTAALLVHAVRRLGWSVADLRWAEAADRSRLLRTSVHFALPQVGATFIFNAAAPAIGAVAGSSAVAAYHILQRLLGAILQVQQIAIAPTWPGYTDAAARGDAPWIARSYRISLLASAIGVGVPLLGLSAFAPAIVRIWSGTDSLPITAALVGAVAIWNYAIALGHPPSHLLGGLGRVRRLAYYTTAGHLVSAAAMFALGRAWGASGVVFGLAAGFIVLGLPGAFLEARAALHTLASGRPATGP